MANPVQIKGQAFFSLLSAVGELKGLDAERSVRESIAGDLGQALRFGGLIANGWYPVAWLCSLHAHAQQVTREGPDFARVLGRAATRRDVLGIYKLMFRLLSPTTLFKQSERILRLAVNGGRFTVTEHSGSRVRGRYSELHGFDGNLWRDLVGSGEEVLALCGAKSLETRVLSGGTDSDDFMDIETHWR